MQYVTSQLCLRLCKEYLSEANKFSMAWFSDNYASLCCDGFSYSLLQKLRKPQRAKADQKLLTHPVYRLKILETNCVNN